MVIKGHTRAERIEEFGNQAEKPKTAAPRELPVRDLTEGEPSWKLRNREPKHKGTQFRFSESQLKLLQMAKKDQEISIQKILEQIVWPVLEERYGVTTKDSPS